MNWPEKMSDDKLTYSHCAANWYWCDTCGTKCSVREIRERLHQLKCEGESR